MVTKPVARWDKSQGHPQLVGDGINSPMIQMNHLEHAVKHLENHPASMSLNVLAVAVHSTHSDFSMTPVRRFLLRRQCIPLKRSSGTHSYTSNRSGGWVRRQGLFALCHLMVGGHPLLCTLPKGTVLEERRTRTHCDSKSGSSTQATCA
jgi:hypothetical protein